MFSETDEVMEAPAEAAWWLGNDGGCCSTLTAAEVMAASWLNDLIIMRPLGPTLGVIFLVA